MDIGVIIRIMKVKNRFWVMKNLPEGNNFQNALEIREESEL